MRICRRNFNASLLGGLASTPILALPNSPKLLVLVLLQQFRGDYLSANSSALSSGGFRKLMERGAWFPDCRHAASTFTSTTVATLATGAWPAQHGIVADAWYDRAANQRVPASDEALEATTLAAQIAADSRNRVYVVSDTEPLARIFTGSPAVRRFWMDEAGQFATSGEIPGWLTAFNATNSPDSFREAKWTALGARPEAPPLRVLKYDANRPGEFTALLKSSPYAQSTQFDLLNECMIRERLGQGDTFDVVCLISGAMDRLGHETGGRAKLMSQMALQLDRNLETLFGRLGRAVGDAGFNLVVAAGHGAPPEPSDDARARAAVDGELVAQAVDKGLKEHQLGAVERYLYPFLYLDTSAWRDPEPIRQAAARAALHHPGVADYFTAGGDCSVHNEWERRFRNSFHAARSGDVMLSYKAEYVEKFAGGRGVSYGSLYNYDVRTPLFFYGPQFRPGVFEAPVESVDVAVTLARAIGVAAPSSSAGRVLSEALAE